MRLLFVCLLPVLLTIASVFSAHAQETAVPLQTQMDPHLKSIMDIISTALLQKIPGATKDSKIEISPESTLQEGRVAGQWNVSIAESPESAPSFAMVGSIGLNLVQRDGVYLQMESQAQTSKDDFYQMLSMSHQKMGGDPQLFTDASLSSAVVLQKYKEQMIAFVQSMTSSAPPKKKQSFGSRKTSEVSESAALDSETAQQLTAAIEQSFIIAEANGQTSVQIDVAATQSAMSKVAQKYPFANLLGALGSIRIQMDASTVQIQVTSQFAVSDKVIQAYDAYLSQQQSQTDGLAELSQLITKLGAWAVGRCSTEAYQALCVDNLLNVCTKNVDRVQKCVDDAKTIQSSREANTSGDHFSTIANGVSLLKSRTGTSIEDWWNGEGEEAETPAPEGN